MRMRCTRRSRSAASLTSPRSRRSTSTARIWASATRSETRFGSFSRARLPKLRRPERRTTMASTKTPGLSAEEKAAARERVRELKAEAKRGASREAGEQALLANVAAMPTPDRVMAERLHAIVTENAPELAPKTWYG